MSYSRTQLIEYLGEINIDKKRVLDIGAGDGSKWAKNFVRGIPTVYKTADVQKFDGIDFIIDLNEPLEQLKDTSVETIGTYDVVFCLETLEHLWNPIQAVQNLSKLTEDTLYLSTPFINPIHDLWDYLRYTFQWYEKVLPKYGFREVNVQSRVTRDLNVIDEFYKTEGMRMSKVTLQKGYGEHYFDVGYFVEAKK